jgi:hypothetical protein
MDYTKIPANLINKYLWDLARGYVAGKTKVVGEVWGLDVDDIGYSPFFPVSEVTGPVSENPFVTYQSGPRLPAGPRSTDYWLNKERMIYTIVAPMPSNLYISNFIHKNLSRFDVSAEAINRHLQDGIVYFDTISAYVVNQADETTKYDSATPRFASEIIVDFDYRRTDLED